MTDPEIIEAQFRIKPGAEVFGFIRNPPLTTAEAIQATLSRSSAHTTRVRRNGETVPVLFVPRREYLS